MYLRAVSFKEYLHYSSRYLFCKHDIILPTITVSCCNICTRKHVKSREHTFILVSTDKKLVFNKLIFAVLFDVILRKIIAPTIQWKHNIQLTFSLDKEQVNKKNVKTFENS